ncbi:MAG: hypothetical protein KFB95_08840 [Simkaniaceae bacterium]|nr:MAG: hypothetical protein KFB95_08840 [Simkaniaceae bacterium]
MKHQKFWTERLFEKQNEVQMSFQEIADFFWRQSCICKQLHQKRCQSAVYRKMELFF